MEKEYKPKSQYIIITTFYHKGRMIKTNLYLNNCLEDIKFRWGNTVKDASKNLNFTLYHADKNGNITELATTKNQA